MTPQPPVTVRAARSDELSEVEELLRQVRLPIEGIDRLAGLVLVAHAGGRVVGSAALELYHASGLLRSVAVDPSFQGRGIGARLTEATLSLARDRRIRHIYLLTETASEFFPRFGFRVIGRGDVDPAVQQSEEFARLCPDSAVAMVLDLEG
ncbi:MAG: arsenic resistance N-acetyltransferase ArsN2 [Gemmatimonadota bacterium]|nr:arsenic resistance N-acetyltransferase ArsN2 [Gemmatimonadota bacterium]MDH3366447.1 arsenic resistance N-acetyltransferase ArsN2 [Gemmatimonadota bacterium]MDH3476691.1 arsenic resistance N-acetyltransferase ArsN2 [Gemmatimonadota bacterium]MDH3570890.1 arsenic resistance N-acetyltransferase ArsN2 [Gemmatimonadota bacterium]MDH5549882.1 arsenic resistance N-acetyltransferase ArsN2 [Gemmatimonadota bacterium]